MKLERRGHFGSVFRLGMSGEEPRHQKRSQIRPHFWCLGGEGDREDMISNRRTQTQKMQPIWPYFVCLGGEDAKGRRGQSKH